jgi:iron complex outermembrane receptor protein
LYRYNTSAIDFYAPDILYNIGDMQSNGFEVLLNYNAIKTKSFDWTTSINFATNVSKFLSLSKGDFKFGSNGELFIANAGAPGLNNTTMIRVKENDLLGQIYGPRYTGAKADGTALFADLDGDGVIEPEGDDREVLGNGLPKITLGWNNTFKYNNFDFNFFFRGVFGHSLINTYRIFYENANAGQIAGFNRIKTTNWDPNLKDAKFGSHVVEKADFLRLDNFTLGYTLPLPQGGVFTNARFFLAGNNLFTITKYTGIDPEPRYGDVYDSDNGGYAGAFDPLAPGIERRSTYNRVRSFSLGVQLGF